MQRDGKQKKEGGKGWELGEQEDGTGIKGEGRRKKGGGNWEKRRIEQVKMRKGKATERKRGRKVGEKEGKEKRSQKMGMKGFVSIKIKENEKWLGLPR